MQEALITAFREGDTERALATSRQWAEALAASGHAPDQIAAPIARAAATAYRELVTDPVHEYQAQVAQALPEAVGAWIEKALGRLIDQSLLWEQRLEVVYRERLAREIRDYTRGRHHAAAADNIRLLCGAARSDEDAARLAQYCGAILGTCDNHPREVETVLALLAKDPAACNLTHALVTELRQARQKRLETLLASRMETREIEWLRSLTETIVEIQRLLPPKDRLDEPDPALLRDTADLMRALVRVPLWRNQPEKFIDATLLLVEFVPKDLALAAAQSGIEQRAYLGLGFTAKKAVLLAFGELGDIPDFVAAYETYARETMLATPYLKFFLEVMGATRTPRFHHFLVECFADKRLGAVRDEIVDALGAIGDTEARNLLLGHLGEALSARVVDPPRIRTAECVLASLGKLSKSPRLTTSERADLVRRAIGAIPRDQTRLALKAALQFFSTNPDPLPADLKHWAVEALSQALWLQDDTPEWAQGAERQETLLGFRQPMVEVLARLVPEVPQPFVERIERQALRYSGAYMAVAEVCEKARLQAALPALESMLRNALVFDDSDLNRYEAETYWDATAQQRVRLSKDGVIGPLVHAIGVIGGNEARRILAQLDDQIRSGRVGNPGPDTARFLMNFLAALDNEFGEAGRAGRGEAGAESGSGTPALDPRRRKDLLKVLDASFFLTGTAKRRMRKIAAISELGQHTPPEAIDPLIAQLVDKDDMVRGAARTALLEYQGHRVPNESRARLVNQLASALHDKDPAMRQEALRTFRELGAARPEIRSVLQRELTVADSATLQKQLQLLLHEGGAGKSPSSGAGASGAGASGAGASGAGASGAGSPPSLGVAGGGTGGPSSGQTGPPDTEAPLTGVSLLEQKRLYVLARQEWIRGGKKGPAPEPPSGG